MATLTSLNERIQGLEARLSTLYAARGRLVGTGTNSAVAPVLAHKQPSGSSCSFPPAHNFTNWSGADVKLPEPWCSVESRHPPARSTVELARSGDSGPTVILPSLLVPCCAHSGTTFLWRCMAYAFHPQRVCGHVSGSPHNPAYATRYEQWALSECGGRSYLLPGLTGNIEGHWDYRKEWFFYGGGASSWSKGWQDYVGVELPLCWYAPEPKATAQTSCAPSTPEPRSPTQLPADPNPRCTLTLTGRWEPEFQRLLRERPLDDTLALSRRLCRHTFSDASGATRQCTHRACIPLDLHKVATTYSTIISILPDLSITSHR